MSKMFLFTTRYSNQVGEVCVLIDKSVKWQNAEKVWRCTSWIWYKRRCSLSLGEFLHPREDAEHRRDEAPFCNRHTTWHLLPDMWKDFRWVSGLFTTALFTVSLYIGSVFKILWFRKLIHLFLPLRVPAGDWESESMWTAQGCQFSAGTWARPPVLWGRPL